MMGNFAILGVIGPIVMSALYYAVFLRAGFQGRFMAVSLLPFLFCLLSTFAGLVLTGEFVVPFEILIQDIPLSSISYVLPLIMLLSKDWPDLVVVSPAHASDDVFK